MIVKCEQCQTKFKIPDEKVTEKGVKVRCTKCQHTFRVKRSGNDAVVDDGKGAGPSAGAPPGWKPDSAVTEPRAQPGKVQPTPSSVLRDANTSPANFAFDPSAPFGAPPPAAPSAPEAKTSPVDDPFALDGPPAPTAPMPAVGAKGASPSAPAFGTSSVNMNAMYEDPLADVPPLAEPAPDRGMFDMPALPEPAPGGSPLDVAPPPSTGPSPFDRPSPQLVVQLGKPSGRPEDVGIEGRPPPGAARRVTGLVVNLAIATVLVLGIATAFSVYVNEGKLGLSSFSLERVKGLWVRNDLVALDVSNGLYETRGGRSVFFVRGEVSNRGKRAAKVRVRAEILDGTQVLQSSETLVGATPTPEDLYRLGSPQDAAALATKLDEGAVEVAPGKRGPFLVTFYDYPPDLAGLRLRVTLKDSAGATAAR